MLIEICRERWILFSSTPQFALGEAWQGTICFENRRALDCYVCVRGRGQHTQFGIALTGHGMLIYTLISVRASDTWATHGWKNRDVAGTRRGSEGLSLDTLLTSPRVRRGRVRSALRTSTARRQWKRKALSLAFVCLGLFMGLLQLAFVA